MPPIPASITLCSPTGSTRFRQGSASAWTLAALTLGVLTAFLTGGCATGTCENDPGSVFCRGTDDQNGGATPPVDCAELEPGMTCDPVRGLRCSQADACTCGNSIVDRGEECDDPNDRLCRPDCTRGCSQASDCPPQVCRGPSTCENATCVGGTPLPTGTLCPGGICSGEGTCVSCANVGAACVPENECAFGVIACVDGQPVCQATSLRPPGTPCGNGGTCSADGQCLNCANVGEACQPANSCFNGIIACTDNIPSCQPTTPKDAGTSCEDGGECSGFGECLNCEDAGSSCNPGNECREGVIVCDTPNTPRCNPGALKPPGTACGVGGTCDETGQCIDCARAGEACQHANPCYNGVIECDEGVACCSKTTPKPPGTACGPNATCDGAGACIPDNVAGCRSEHVAGKGYIICLDQRRTWHDAANFCAHFGYTLLRIHNAAEQAFFSTPRSQGGFIGNGPGGAMWLGGYDAHSNGTWRWLNNGDVFTQCSNTSKSHTCVPQNALFNGWLRGEPNNHRGAREDCVQMRENFGSIAWNDIPCHTKLPFVCQRN